MHKPPRSSRRVQIKRTVDPSWAQRTYGMSAGCLIPSQFNPPDRCMLLKKMQLADAAFESVRWNLVFVGVGERYCAA